MSFFAIGLSFTKRDDGKEDYPELHPPQGPVSQSSPWVSIKDRVSGNTIISTLH